MLLRNLVLHFYDQEGASYKSLPHFVETVAAKPHLACRLLRAS